MTKICVRILKVEGDAPTENENNKAEPKKYCVEVTKMAGPLLPFQEHLKELKSVLDWANDATLEPSTSEAENTEAVEESKEELK